MPPIPPSSAPVASLEQEAERWRIPLENSPQLGKADALVTIIEFGNYQCPRTRAVQPEVDAILKKHVGEVRLVWKDDPLAIHSYAEGAAHLAREARAQKGEDGFWSAHHRIFEAQPQIDVPQLLTLAPELELDAEIVRAAIVNRKHSAAISSDADIVDDFGIVDTPFFVVNGRPVLYGTGDNVLGKTVERELVQARALLARGIARRDVYATVTAGGRGPKPLERRAPGGVVLRNPYVAGADAAGEGRRVVVEMHQFCSYDAWLCRRFEPVVSKLLELHPELIVRWRDVPTTGSVSSQLAAVAAREAYLRKGTAGYERMRRFLFDGAARDGGLTRPALLYYARAIGLEEEEFNAALDSAEHAADIAMDVEAARRAKIEKAPAFLICPGFGCARGGYYLRGAPPLRSFEKRIRRAIEESRAMR